VQATGDYDTPTRAATAFPLAFHELEKTGAMTGPVSDKLRRL